LVAADAPQFGQAWSRNVVSAERNLPATFDPENGTNVRWSVDLGTDAHATPVIANGRVYMGTNNNRPRDPRHQGDRGVLMCFDEQDGRLLWQLVIPKLDPSDPYKDWPNMGICSPPTVEGDRVYAVSNRGEVLCLDPLGMANGNDGPFQEEGSLMVPPGEPALEPGPLDADVIWKFDLVKEAGTYPHDSAHANILIHGPHLYLNSCTGVDNTHRVIRTPDAPSLVVLDKATGRMIGRDDEKIAPRVFHCTWSSVSLCEVAGVPRVFLAGGDGIVYGFDLLATNAPPSGVTMMKAVWKYDPDPGAAKTEVHRFTSNKLESPSNIYGMPVVLDGRLYVAGGGDLWWGKNNAWLHSVNLGGRGDVTSTGRLWAFSMERHVMSTPAVADGLVYTTDTARHLYCVDAESGREIWRHDLKGDVWASPLVADGKVYLGSRKGDFWTFAHGREKKVLGSVELGKPISATAVAANGSLYVATLQKLWALKSPREGGTTNRL
jgi:outer membrane protein assembly factor BamB